MKNNTYRLVRKWKLFLLLPLVFASLCLYSCAVKSIPDLTYNDAPEISESTGLDVDANSEETTTSHGAPALIGYPSRSQSFSADWYTLGECYVIGHPVNSKDTSLEGNKLEKKYVTGYPTEPKILLAPTAGELRLLIKD